MFLFFIILALIWYVWNQIFYAGYSRKYWGFPVALYRSILLSIIMFPLVFFGNFSGMDMQTLWTIWIIWFIWAYWVILQFDAYKYLPAGIVSSIMNAYNIIVLFLWYLVYNETFSFLGFIWIILLFLSVIVFSLVKVDFEHLHKDYQKWIWLILLRTSTYALWVFMFSYYAREFEPLSVAYLSELSVLIWFVPILIYRLYFHKNEKIFVIKKNSLLKLFFITFLPAMSSVAIFFAVLYWNIWTVTLSLSSASLFTAIVSYFLYKEKLNFIQFWAIFLSILWLILIHI
jgi:drug/metabolite transporter (DMT)-like permease